VEALPDDLSGFCPFLIGTTSRGGGAAISQLADASARPRTGEEWCGRGGHAQRGERPASIALSH
jgi:hypothetical protein